MGKTFNTGTLVNGLSTDANGNVGINTSNPAYKLDVTGTGRFTGQLFLGTGTSSYTIGGGSATAGGLTDKDVTLKAWSPTSGTNEYGGDLILAAGVGTGNTSGKLGNVIVRAGTEGSTSSTLGTLSTIATFTKTGLGIGVSTPMAPLNIAYPAVGSAISATNAQTAYDYSRFRIKHYSDSNLGLSIGYAGANWTYIQACYNEGSTAPLLLNPYGGEVRVGTGGLKFANGSTAINYYEEGTFTPTNISSNMSAVTPTFGRYVRIGSQVTINVRWAVEPGGTGQKYLVFNLPFAFNGAGGVSYTGSVSNYNSGLSAYSSNVGTSVRNSSGSDTQQYVEAVFISNTSTTMLFSMTYFTF
jgi:hypothetical protein